MTYSHDQQTRDRPDAPALGHQLISTLSAQGPMECDDLVERVAAEHYQDIDQDDVAEQVETLVDRGILYRDGDEIRLPDLAGGDDS
jgi:hypothetical protein